MRDQRVARPQYITIFYIVSHDRSKDFVSSFKIQVSRDLDSGFKVQGSRDLDSGFKIQVSGVLSL